MRDDADAGCGPRNGVLTESSEDYLEAILVIRRLRGSCRNVDIAERLGVSKASVTKALSSLSAAGFAEVVGRDVRLTPEGGRVAGSILEHHRFFESMLLEAGVGAKIASEEALPHGTLPFRGLVQEALREPRGSRSERRFECGLARLGPGSPAARDVMQTVPCVAQRSESALWAFCRTPRPKNRAASKRVQSNVFL